MSEPTPSAAENRACENTDRELWREREGDYHADSIHVTQSGGIGINCGGSVHVKPLREWHKLASRHSGQAVDALRKRPVTDAEVDEFMREYHEGKHPLSPELEAALKEMEPRLFAEIRDIINRGKPHPGGQDKGEWTEETVYDLLAEAFESGGEIRGGQLIAQRHNTAIHDLQLQLAADRQRAEALQGFAEKSQVYERQLLSALAAIEDLFAMMDEGLLVRDISKDHEADYFTRAAKFSQRLLKAKEALK